MDTTPLTPGPDTDQRNGQGELLLVERIEHDGADIALVTLNRPAQHNPVDHTTLDALDALLAELTAAGGPQAIVLTGAGPAFSAGGDLRSYQRLFRDPSAFRAFMETFYAVCRRLEECSALTIAMVNGTCMAGGLELALACDLITISESARIGDGHLRFGQLPGAGSSQRLVRAIGVARAKEWLLTARLYDAATAYSAGLTTLVAPHDELRRRTLELAVEVTRLSPLGRQRMKQLITIAQNTPLDEGLRCEIDLVHAYATTSHDALEGLDSFAERRPARYLGR